MLFRRCYDEGLAQASYIIACEKTREAIVVDPNRDADNYIRLAAMLRVDITRVTETHIHADFLSGSRELAHRTGAQLHLSGTGPADWRYGFAKDAGALSLQDGEALDIGTVRLTAVHTPGHTPEHMSFLLTDTTRGSAPMGALTGDFIFVGDVGRPDLLEKAAGFAGSADIAARQLYQSIRSFLRNPDHLQIWPGHGAGSACGKSLNAMPHSTLGYERVSNWALLVSEEEEFVRRVLEGQPQPPRYFAVMKTMNREGPRLLESVKAATAISADELATAFRTGSTVLDTRAASVYAAEHVRGSLNIPLNKSFANWAGSILPYDKPVYLIVDANRADQAEAAVRLLSLIGMDEVAGWVPWDSLAGWKEKEFPLSSTRQVQPDEVAGSSKGRQVVDVRARYEWDAGHIPGAIHIPLGELSARVGELDAARSTVVHCQGGGRSAIAASILEKHGFENAANLPDGFSGWKAAGLPVETSTA